MKEGKTVAKCVIGIDLGGTSATGAVATLSGEILATETIPTPQEGGIAILKALLELVAKLSKGRELQALGLGVPGMHDLEKGICVFSGNINWYNIPVVDYFREKLKGIPVYLDNDAQVAALGELHYGAARGYRDFLYVAVGTGIGAGIYIDGKVLRGSSGSAGELGHMVMLPAGLPCTCGGQGCLETLASATALAREGQLEASKDKTSLLNELAAQNEGKVTAKMVSQAYDRGDRAAKQAFERSMGWLGVGLASYVNIFNPALLVIGGGVSLAGKKLLRVVRKKIDKHALQVSREQVTVTVSALKDKAGMYGALALALGGGGFKKESPP